MRHILFVLLLAIPASLSAQGRLDLTFEPDAGTSVAALRNISLSIEKGELVAILGESGAGKTTFMRIFGDFAAPTGGKYEVLYVDHAAERYAEFEVTGRGLDPALMPNGQVRMRDGIELQFGPYWFNTSRGTGDVGRLSIAVGVLVQADQLLAGHRTPGAENGYFPEGGRFLIEGGQIQRVSLERPLTYVPIIIVAENPTTGSGDTSAETAGGSSVGGAATGQIAGGATETSITTATEDAASE